MVLYISFCFVSIFMYTYWCPTLKNLMSKVYSWNLIIFSAKLWLNIRTSFFNGLHIFWFQCWKGTMVLDYKKFNFWKDNTEAYCYLAVFFMFHNRIFSVLTPRVLGSIFMWFFFYCYLLPLTFGLSCMSINTLYTCHLQLLGKVMHVQTSLYLCWIFLSVLAICWSMILEIYLS